MRTLPDPYGKNANDAGPYHGTACMSWSGAWRSRSV